jgi:PIN domain nuclease of toxin-antitoxin system
LAVSAITLWELGLLVNRGRIQIHGTVKSSIRQLLEDVTIRPITDEIAALAVQFPDDYPRDPADRLIGATARAEGLTLITRDDHIRRSRLIKTVWSDRCPTPLQATSAYMTDPMPDMSGLMAEDTTNKHAEQPSRNTPVPNA